MYEPDANKDNQTKKAIALHNGEEVEVIELTQLVEGHESEVQQDDGETTQNTQVAHESRNSQDSGTFEPAAPAEENFAQSSQETGLEARPESPLQEEASGDKPSGDKPSGDSPSGDSPSGDSPSGDSPSGNSPSDVEPFKVEPSNVEPSNVEPLDSVSDQGLDVPDMEQPLAESAAKSTQASAEDRAGDRTGDRPEYQTGAHMDALIDMLINTAMDDDTPPAPAAPAPTADKDLGDLAARLQEVERTLAVQREETSTRVYVNTTLKSFSDRIERIEHFTVNDKPVSAAFAMRLAECEDRIDLSASARDLAALEEEVNALKGAGTGGESAANEAREARLAVEEVGRRLDELSQSAKKAEKKLGQRILVVEVQARKDEKKLSQELKGALKTLEEVETRVKTVGKKQEEALTTLSRTMDERVGDAARKLDKQAEALRSVADRRKKDEERLDAIEKNMAALPGQLLSQMAGQTAPDSAELAGLRQAFDEAGSNAQALAGRVDELDRKLSSLPDEMLARMREQTDSTNAERVERLQGQLDEAGSRTGRIEERVDGLEKGLANAQALAGRVDELDKRLSALPDEVLARVREQADNSNVERLQGELEEADARAKKLEARVDELEKSLANALSLAERLGKRVEAMETMLSEDALEKTTARACLRVLREEIGRITSR